MLKNRGERGALRAGNTVGARERAEPRSNEELTQISRAQCEMKIGGPIAGGGRASNAGVCTNRTLGCGYSKAGSVTASAVPESCTGVVS